MKLTPNVHTFILNIPHRNPICTSNFLVAKVKIQWIFQDEKNETNGHGTSLYSGQL